MNFLDKVKLFESAFTTFERNEETNYKLKDTAPEFMTDIVREVHGRLMPDDFTYNTIYGVVSCLEDYKVDSTDSDHSSEIIDSLIDVYTHNLKQWFNKFSEYCDDAQAEGLVSEDSSMSDRMMAGQYQHISEIYYSVVKEIDETDFN